MTQEHAGIIRGLLESQALRDAVEAAFKDESASLVSSLCGMSRDGKTVEAARIIGEMDAFDRAMKVLEKCAAQYRVSREA